MSIASAKNNAFFKNVSIIRYSLLLFAMQIIHSAMLFHTCFYDSNIACGVSELHLIACTLIVITSISGGKVTPSLLLHKNKGFVLASVQIFVVCSVFFQSAQDFMV